MAQCRDCGGDVRLMYPGRDPENGPRSRICVRCGADQYEPPWRARFMEWLEGVQYESYMCGPPYRLRKPGRIEALWLGAVAWPVRERWGRLLCRVLDHRWDPEQDMIDPENGGESHVCGRCGYSVEFYHR